MIDKKIVEFIVKKMNSFIWYFVVIGAVFFVLATAIVFYPELIQLLFIISFYVVAFVAFLIALRLDHVNQIVKKFDVSKKFLKFHKMGEKFMKDCPWCGPKKKTGKRTVAKKTSRAKKK